MIEKKAEEYKQLKASKKAIEKRLFELRHDILATLVMTGEVPGLKLQVRDMTTFDEDKVWERMDRYGVPHYKFTKKVIDPVAVEQLYWDGVLTDDDLRHIRVPKTSFALVEEGEDVQEIDEGIRSGL